MELEIKPRSTYLNLLQSVLQFGIQFTVGEIRNVQFLISSSQSAITKLFFTITLRIRIEPWGFTLNQNLLWMTINEPTNNLHKKKPQMFFFTRKTAASLIIKLWKWNYFSLTNYDALKYILVRQLLSFLLRVLSAFSEGKIKRNLRWHNTMTNYIVCNNKQPIRINKILLESRLKW